jgi:NAD(P)H-dependent flavin oxidoreductase YrpB (nitropropane dioxygenase family)
MDVMSYGCLQSLVLVVAAASEVQRQDGNKLRSHSGGIAMEIGIEPSARHAADLGIIPVVIEDACGGGHAAAAQRSCQALHFAGDAIMTDTEAFCAALGRAGDRA